MVDFFAGMEMNYYMLIAVLFALFMILGCALEATSILILTMPFLFPITEAYGLNPEWFDVFVNMMMVMSGIRPPVNLNVFVVHGVCPDVSINDTFKGALPFCLRSRKAWRWNAQKSGNSAEIRLAGRPMGPAPGGI